MKNLTIVCGTNRHNSYTEKVAQYYKKLLEEKGYNALLLSMAELPKEVAFSEVFGNRSAGFDKIIEKYIDSTDHFILVSPEYNGSFPGILKVFFDAVHPAKWMDKKFCLTGVSGGRAGNLRGLEHLTNILHYLKIHVYHNKLPISQVDKIFTGTEVPANQETVNVINKQLEGFLRF
jgi:NAD(P)H-dependent FMN reductase